MALPLCALFFSASCCSCFEVRKVKLSFLNPPSVYTQKHKHSPHTPKHTALICLWELAVSFFWLNTPLGPFCLFLPYFTTFHVLSSFLSLVSSVCLFIYFSGCLFSLFNGENCLCHAPPSISNITCTGATSNSSPNATFEKHFLFNTQLSFCSGMFVCVTLKEKMFRPWGLVTVEFMDVT